MVAGVDNAYIYRRELVVPEVVEDSIDEVDVHDNNPFMIAFAFAKLLAIDNEMARSQLRRFAPEKLT